MKMLVSTAGLILLACYCLINNSQAWSSAPKLVRIGSKGLDLLHPALEEDADFDHDGTEVETQVIRPTKTELEDKRPEVETEKLKIVVLGASGRIGRLVVQQLMERKDIDMKVIAFVRDLGKANWALFDEMLVPRYVRKKGPELHLVLGDLVPPQEVAHFSDKEEEKDWKRRAASAAKFYGNRVKDYENREWMPDGNEALEEAIQGASVIISCVGATRWSNIWSDYICFWRLFQRDASRWCRDPSHPFYVHYHTTRKALEYAEREQLKREAEREKLKEKGNLKPESEPERLRFIRISDLMLSKSPWTFVPVIANIFHSMIFRYQDMTERILEESPLLDTIILRPGDLTDEERDTETTHLQVSETGRLPYPAVVSREDVASLAVASALVRTQGDNQANVMKKNGQKPTPFHLTLAVRWCGEIDPPHSGTQGRKEDGGIDANTVLRKVLFGDVHNRRKKRARSMNPTLLRKFVHKLTRRRLKPYAVFVAFPVYFFLSLLLISCASHIPCAQEQWNVFAGEVIPSVVLMLKQSWTSFQWEGIPNIWKLVSARRSPKYIRI